jgi:serine/threonine-protein kinase HipA
MASGAEDPVIEVPHQNTSFRDLFADILRTRPLDDHSVPGVQDKISNSMISVPVKGKYGPAIVKLTPAGYPRIVQNEAFFLGLAKEAGLAVPRFEVVTDDSGEAALVVQRFDRIETRSGISRVAQEDAVQLLNRWPSAKYLLSTRDVFAAVARVSTAPVIECQKLIKLFALSYIVGNGDLHGKNVSVYRSHELWQLTPAYDVLSTLPYGDRSMAIPLEGRDDNLRLKDFVTIAARHNLNERATAKAVDDVIGACEASVENVPSIGFDDQKTSDLISTMKKRIADLGVGL